jgi:hypothetical protein
MPLVVQSVSKIGHQPKGIEKMKKINPKEVLYIKLGRGGEREKECIDDGTLQIGFREVPHELYLECLASKKWDKVQKAWQKAGKSPGVATNYTNQIRRFYEADKDVLWVTFWKGALWRCFAKPGVDQMDNKTKTRHTVSGWTCEDINGQPLLMSRLSGKLLAMQGFKGTICTVKETEYLLNKINGIEPTEIKEANAALLKLEQKVEAVIRSLTWQDFELLIDLIFRQAGWQRVSVLGGTMKSLDLDLIAPITNERYGVQVKSEANLSDFNKYKTERLNDMQGFTQFYFAVHSPASNLSGAPDAESDDVKLLLPANIARLAVQYGLAQWVIDKAR